MTEESNIAGGDNRDRGQDADRDEDAASHTGDAGGMGKGGATHDDFGKDSGIRPSGGPLQIPKTDPQ